MINISLAAPALDVNINFRSGERSVEFLDEINRSSIVMLAKTGFAPRDVAHLIATKNLWKAHIRAE